MLDRKKKREETGQKFRYRSQKGEREGQKRKKQLRTGFHSLPVGPMRCRKLREEKDGEKTLLWQVRRPAKNQDVLCFSAGSPGLVVLPVRSLEDFGYVF